MFLWSLGLTLPSKTPAPARNLWQLSGISPLPSDSLPGILPEICEQSLFVCSLPGRAPHYQAIICTLLVAAARSVNLLPKATPSHSDGYGLFMPLP